jgi:hypothetical protein
MPCNGSSSPHASPAFYKQALQIMAPATELDLGETRVFLTAILITKTAEARVMAD